MNQLDLFFETYIKNTLFYLIFATMVNEEKKIPFTEEERENMPVEKRVSYINKRGALGILDAIELIAQGNKISLQEVLLGLEAKEKQDEEFFLDKSEELSNLVNLNLDMLKKIAPNMRYTTAELLQLLKEENKNREQ